jgi:expansin (peptidoglycan-binding protein)
MRGLIAAAVAAAALLASCALGTNPGTQDPEAGLEAKALYYTFPLDGDGYPTDGVAGFGPVADDMPQLYKDGYVMAVNEELFNAGPEGGSGEAAMAGETYEVAGPDGTITLMVADMSLSTGGANQIDIHRPVWEEMYFGSAGAIPVALRWVPAPVSGNLKLYFTSGSNQWYFGITVYNHRIGVAKVEVMGSPGGATGGQWMELPRDFINRFEHLAAADIGLPITVRVTSKQGEQVLFGPIASIAEGNRHTALGQFTNLAPDTLPVTWPGPPAEIYIDALEDRQDVAWEAIGVILTPATPDPYSTTSPYSGSYTLAAGSFGGFGQLRLLYPVPFESSRFRGVELWVRSSAAASGFSVWVSDGTNDADPLALPALAPSWQKVTYLFAGRNVPVLIDRVVLGKTTSGSSPDIFLDYVRMLE